MKPKYTLAISLTLSASAIAQSSPTGPLPATQPPAASGDSPAMTLGEIVVTGSAGPLNTRRILSSVDIVPTERIERKVATHNWQLFDQVPGAMITQFGQGTTSGKFSMRGFNGEGEINAVKLLIDGIPSNSNDGNMPYIDLPPRVDIESIEVVRGTNDPRYGLHNIAGNANIRTRSGGNYLIGRGTLGAFGTRDLQAGAGFDRDGLSQNYALGLQRSNGYRDHSDADSQTFSGKWYKSLGDGRTRLGLIARHHDAKAQEAGYLTEAQARANPHQSPAHNATDEDRRRVSQFAVQLESALASNLFATGQVYLNQLDDRRFVRFSSTVSQQERYVAEQHLGAAATVTWRAGTTAIGDLSISGGLDAERQQNRSERYNTVSQARTAQTRNQDFDLNTVGGFAQVVIKSGPALTITPAWRIDRITGQYTNRLNGQSYAANDYGAISQPKLSAVYALSPADSLYANWGRSFQIGVGTASYKVNQASDLAPSINEGWETGLKFRPLPWLDGRVAVWEQVASNEARRRLNDPANDAENIGKTRRRGFDLQLNARPNAKTSLWVVTALQRSKILVADAASANTTGREIDHVPHLLYNFGADYRPVDAWRFSLWANGQSGYFLERTNSTGKYGAYFVAHLSAAWRPEKRLELELQLRNLTNRYSEYVWHDGTQSLHAPGAPRGLFVSANATF